MIKGLYIHIPFCKQICLYCDFCKMVANEDLQNQYINALMKEIKYYQPELSSLNTIYIGGGTPSALSEGNLRKLLKQIHKTISVSSLKEFTIEANPNDITQSIIDIFVEYGVNRVSLGVQTIHNKHLKFLKSTHNKEDVIQAVQLLKANHIANINLDFIYSIPGQTLQDIQSDLEFIRNMDVPHISYYSLIIEEKTELHYLVSRNSIQPLDEELEADFKDNIHEVLNSFGYHRYEISNFAKNKKESLHNMIYWNLEEYLGIGLNASSQYNDKRYKNQPLISKYIANTLQHEFPKIEEDCNLKMEYLLLGLRKIQGIDVTAFKKRFHIDLFQAFPDLQKHLDNGLLVIHDEWVRFSEKGLDLSNQVYLDII